MQNLDKAAAETLGKLRQLLSAIGTEVYNERPEALNGASIGQHCRHLLEMFICLDDGYPEEIINYEKRKRNVVIEKDQNAAINCLDALLPELIKPEKRLTLQTGYTTLLGETEECETSYTRELTYVLEHAVHHMALMAVGIRIIDPNLTLPENFGVASATIMYRKTYSS